MNESRSASNHPSISAAALIPGAIVLILGIGFLLGNFGLLHFPIWNLWPLFLVVIGLAKILQGTVPGLIWGLAFAVFGGGLLLNAFGYLPFEAWKLWPVIIVAVGFQLLWAAVAGPHGAGCSPGREQRRAWKKEWKESWNESWKESMWKQTHPQPAAFVPEQWLHVMAIFNEERRRVVSPSLAYAEALAVFGSCQLDLRAMGIPDQAVTIDANCVFGGIEIFIPGNWDVMLKGVGIFGAYQDETLASARTEGKRGQLIVRGVSVFGGVSVKN